RRADWSEIGREPCDQRDHGYSRGGDGKRTRRCGVRRLRPRAAPRRPSVLRLGMLFCGVGVVRLATFTPAPLLRDEYDRETCYFHGYTSSRALRWIAGRRRA